MKKNQTQFGEEKNFSIEVSEREELIEPEVMRPLGSLGMLSFTGGRFYGSFPSASQTDSENAAESESGSESGSESRSPVPQPEAGAERDVEEDLSRSLDLLDQRQQLFNLITSAAGFATLGMFFVVLTTATASAVDPDFHFGVYPRSRIVTDSLCLEVRVIAGNVSITPKNLDYFLGQLRSDDPMRNELTGIIGASALSALASLVVAYILLMLSDKIFKHSGAQTCFASRMLRPCAFLLAYLPIVFSCLSTILLVAEFLLYPTGCVVLLPMLFPAGQLAHISFMYGAAFVSLMLVSMCHLCFGRALLGPCCCGCC